MRTQTLGTTNILVDFCIKLIMLLMFLIVIVPFSPKLPSLGLDSSWALALNQAVAQGLSFGKEIIFTLGPYSSIYTKAYHPATDCMMVGGSLYLAFSYWLCLVFLIKDVRRFWILAFCFFLFAMIYSRDSLFFSYPLLVGLLSCKIISLEHRTGIRTHYFPLFAVVLFAPLGLLTLIKGSFLISCLATSNLCAVFFIVNKRNNLAVICTSSPVISLILFWLVSGQSLGNLPSYIISTLALASGFTQAMSSEGSIGEIILYLLTSACILWLIIWQKQSTAVEKIFILCLYCVFLFVSFKTGFVRHYGHAFIPGTSILLAALLLPFVISCRALFAIVLFSLNSWYYINGHYAKISISHNFISTSSAAWHGLNNRLIDKYWLRTNFAVTMDYLSKQIPLPRMQGTTDIYSYNQIYLISSQNIWRPRPIFQSYSVFTQDLAAKNKRHLQGENRPDNIIFKVEPIDQRMPALEDGASWPLLLANYQPHRLEHDFLYLQKKNGATQFMKPMKLLTSEKHAFGEVVVLSAKDQLLFAEIEFKPTILGYLAIIFFKPSQLYITFLLSNGTQKQYRMIANMAKSGFLISPLVENTNEFALLYGKKNDLNEKKVKSFVITINQDKNWYWNDDYLVHFKRFVRQT